MSKYTSRLPRRPAIRRRDCLTGLNGGIALALTGSLHLIIAATRIQTPVDAPELRVTQSRVAEPRKAKSDYAGDESPFAVFRHPNSEADYRHGDARGRNNKECMFDHDSHGGGRNRETDRVIDGKATYCSICIFVQ